MSTYNTGNPLGSTDKRDLFDNAENLDSAVNSDQSVWVDRFGKTRRTISSIESTYDDALVNVGEYQAGITITSKNQIISDSDKLWRLSPSTSLPYTTTGTGMPEGGAFVSVGDSVLRQDLAVAGGAGLVGNSGIVFDSVADMQTATWLKVGQKVRTLGYYTPGDGGGNDYEIVAAGTGTDDGGSFIDLATSGLQAKGLNATLRTFGVVGDGVTDDTVQFERYLSLVDIAKLDVHNIRLTQQVSVSKSEDFSIISESCKISLDSTEPQETVISVFTTGGRVIVSGDLSIDALDNAFCGFYLDGGTSERELVDISGIKVSNIYRVDTRFNLGDGIFIRGGYKKVNVRNFKIENVKMATGAGVPFSYGVTGLTVFRYSTSVHANDITVSDFEINRVYSEDRTYLMRDQDGIRITQSYGKTIPESPTAPYPSKAIVTRGRTYNCMGRSVKMVSFYGIVEKMQIVRDDTIHANFQMSESEDIDFQCSGGTIRGVRCTYLNNVPYYFANFNVNITQGVRTQTQCLVEDVTVSLFGGVTMNSIMAVVTSNQVDDTAMIKPVINNCAVTGSLINIDSILTINNGANITPLYIFSIIQGVTARIGTSLVKRTNSAVENALLLTSYSNQNTGTTTVPLSSGLSSVNDQLELIGINRRISL